MSCLNGELLLTLVSSHPALKSLSTRCHVMLGPRLTVARTPPSTVLTEAADYGNNLYMIVQGVLQYFVAQNRSSTAAAVHRASTDSTYDSRQHEQRQQQSQAIHACAGLMTVGDSFGSICDEVCSVPLEERCGHLAAGQFHLSHSKCPCPR